EILDALLGPEMEFDPDAFVRRIDHRKGAAAEEVHIPEALRDAAVGHDDCDLMQPSRSKVQKSQFLSALRIPVGGSRLIAWLRSGKRNGSRKKNTGVLLPTRSQLPSSV